MTQMHSRKCFTPIHCEYHSKCALAYQPYTNGYFTPTNVGEHCHHYEPLVLDTDDSDVLVERITRLMGAHE